MRAERTLRPCPVIPFRAIIFIFYFFKLASTTSSSFALFAKRQQASRNAAHVAAEAISISFWKPARSCIFASIAALSSPFRAVSSALDTRRSIAVLSSAGSLSPASSTCTGAVPADELSHGYESEPALQSLRSGFRRSLLHRSHF